MSNYRKIFHLKLILPVAYVSASFSTIKGELAISWIKYNLVVYKREAEEYTNEF